MKKTKLLTSVAALALVLGLGACETGDININVDLGGDDSSDTAGADTSSEEGEHEHTWGEWVTDVAATCEEDGTQKRTCTVCGQEETDVIPATGHQPGTEIVKKDEFGHYFECTVCGYLILEDHTFTGDTYVDEYYHSNTCTVCQYGGLQVHEAPSNLDNKCVCGAELNITGLTYKYDDSLGGYAIPAATKDAEKETIYTGTGETLFIPKQYIDDDGVAHDVVGISKASKADYGAFASAFGTLKNVGLPSTFTYIGAYAFGQASGLGTLERVNIPAHVTYIGEAAFKYESLKTVSFASYGDLETIYDGAFTSAPFTDTEDLVLPESLKEIGKTAFQKCTSIKTVHFGYKLETIGSSGFNGCSALDWVILPDSLQSLGSGTFNTLNTVYYGGTAEQWELVDTDTVFSTTIPNCKIYYYSETQASGCWYYGEEGTPTLW
ncbi:MAG: leucine-rich repeat protein [Coprobacillus sp.]|nr:leucine-rich repeat protein [Coprobacillus sp.]